MCPSAETLPPPTGVPLAPSSDDSPQNTLHVPPSLVCSILNITSHPRHKPCGLSARPSPSHLTSPPEGCVPLTHLFMSRKNTGLRRPKPSRYLVSAPPTQVTSCLFSQAMNSVRDLGWEEGREESNGVNCEGGGREITHQLLAQKCASGHPIPLSPQANPFLQKSIHIRCCINYYKLSGCKQCKFILFTGLEVRSLHWVFLG